MSLTFSLLKPPLPSSKPTTHPSISSPFLHGIPPPSLSLSLPLPISHFSTLSLSPKTLTIKAMKSMQGKVVCATNDKTVAVEVTRLAPHPKYKRRVRKKKKFQAHDPDNLFKVGDWVQLEKCRPISKTKTFLAVLPVSRKINASNDIGIPLQSEFNDEDVGKVDDQIV